jgi:hypothetical protein
MTEPILHIALADDWGMSAPFGEYEVSTRGRHLDEVGYVHATTPDRVDAVLEARYSGLREPLLLIGLSVEGLADAGVGVEWVDGAPRVLGGIPMTGSVVVSVDEVPGRGRT